MRFDGHSSFFFNHCFVAGSIKAKINVSSSRSKCSGNVEMHYEGQWLPVCKDALQNVETQKIICRELNCGQPLNVVDYFGPRAAVPPVISKIECPTNGNMSSCSISPGTSSCPLGHLQCSSKCNNLSLYSFTTLPM